MSEESPAPTSKSRWLSLRPAAVPLLAAVLILGRWLQQGTSNLWTKIGFQPYVPDPNLRWRKTTEEFVWLGLDSLGLVLGVLLGVMVVVWLLRRKGFSRLIRGAEGLASLVVLIPLWAFLSGNPPEGAVETQGSSIVKALDPGSRGALPELPKGEYVAIEHPDSAVAAKLVAGGETFEARFASGFSGQLVFDPAEPSAGISAQFQVDAASVKTGIDLRNEHAQKDLNVTEHPHLRFTLSELHSTNRVGDKLLFEASGEVFLGGRTHGVKIAGSFTEISETLAKDLAIQATAPHVLVQAEFNLQLPETIIGNDGTFDKDKVPVAITLILSHSEKE